MWVVSRMQVHGICVAVLVYRVVVEARSNYKKSYLWWFRNLARSDSTRCNRIDRVRVSPGFFGGGEEEAVWFSVCEALLDDWAYYGSVHIFFKYGMVLVLWTGDPIPLF